MHTNYKKSIALFMILIHLTPDSSASVADRSAQQREGVCSYYYGAMNKAFRKTFGSPSELITKSLAIYMGLILGGRLGMGLAQSQLCELRGIDEMAVWVSVGMVAGAITGSKFDTFLRRWYKEVMNDNV